MEDGEEISDPPPHLSGQAARTWSAVLAEWLLSAEELLTLQGALESWDTYREARATVREEGAVVTVDGSPPKRHPAVLVARDSLRDYRAGIRELGVSSQVEV